MIEQQQDVFLTTKAKSLAQKKTHNQLGLK